MRYTAHSQFLAPVPAWIRHPFPRILWRVVSFPLIALCCFGELCAALFCEAVVPCIILTRTSDSSRLHWTVAAVSQFGIAGICVFLLWAFWRRFRLRIVDVDIAMALAGSALALLMLMVAFGGS